MARTWNDLLSDEGRRGNWHIPDPIPFAVKSLLEALEGVGHPKKWALGNAAEIAVTHGLTPHELLFLWVRERNLLFAAGRAEVKARRSKS